MVEKLQDALAYPPRGMDAARAAAYSGVSRSKFLELVAQGVMPQPKDLGGAPRWDRRDLDAAWDALADRAGPTARRRTSMDDLLGEWMAILNLRYVNSYRDRHGRRRYYFRRGGRNVAALPGVPGTSVFAEAYEEQLRQHAPELMVRKGKLTAAAEGTLGWVIAQYQTSDFFKSKKPSTKEVYLRIFDWLRSHFGAADLATIQERHVRKIRNMLKDRPSVADHTVDKIGMLWRYAKEHLDMDELGPNPAREVAAIHTTRESHKAWPAELCAAFEALNSPRLVRAYYLLRYTGQRRSDVVKMRRDQFDGTAIEVVQEKTGTPCWIPCHATLREHLNRPNETSEFLLSNSWGRPYRATSITNMICKICSDLGYPGYSPHGLRHLAGAALAESSCSVHEIMAILGHLTEREANEYVRQAQRKVMARSAIDKWQAKDGTAEEAQERSVKKTA